jgi:DNA-binding MarR family transcriptional regulator
VRRAARARLWLQLQPIVKSATTADPPALELERFLPYRLSVLANTMSAAIATAYAERFELSIPEWRVLAVLARSPGLSAAQVAERTAMDKVAVSRAVAALARARRVERAVEESDRRRSVLQLTPRGHAVYREVVPLALAYEDAVLRGLPARARQKLDSLLEDLQRRARSLRSARMLREPPKEAATPALREPRPTRTSRE